MSHRLRISAIATLTSLISSPALAHHAMGGETPHNLLEGLVSGLAHPVIGPDHLAFVVAAGVIGMLAGRPLLVTGVLVVASTAGTFIRLRGLDMPFAEPLIAASVLAGGLLIALWQRMSMQKLALLLPFAALIHGYAYGESIIGAEQEPVAAYLLGLTLVQTAIAAVGATAFRLAQDRFGTAGATYAAGGVLACAGMLFSLLAAFATKAAT